MFFKNLEQIMRQAQLLYQMDHEMIDQILQNGHDWADDHVSVAKENMDQVFDFIMNTKTAVPIAQDLINSKEVPVPNRNTEIKNSLDSISGELHQFESKVAKFEEYIKFSNDKI